MNPDHESLLDDLLADEDTGFTGWELDFLDSLDKVRSRPLSEKQAGVLYKLARRAGLLD